MLRIRNGEDKEKREKRNNERRERVKELVRKGWGDSNGSRCSSSSSDTLY